MPNEFYAVKFLHDGDVYYFKSRDKAFDFLWQEFLNLYAADYTDVQLEEIKKDMYYWYQLGDFGGVYVCGFED